MKSMMLIAGRGTRLQPLTDYIPKCCLPVAGVPLLHIWMRMLKAAGVTELLLNPSYGGTYIRERMFCESQVSPCFQSVKFSPEKNPIGTAQTLRKNAVWVDGEDFLVIYGDVLTNLNLRYLIQAHKKRKAMITMVVNETSVPKEKGIVTVDGRGWATDFDEKPREPNGNLAFSGILVAKAVLLKHIGEQDVDLGYDVLPRIIKSGKNCCVYTDPEVYIRDIGTIPAYLACQEEWRRLNEND